MRLLFLLALAALAVPVAAKPQPRPDAVYALVGGLTGATDDGCSFEKAPLSGALLLSRAGEWPRTAVLTWSLASECHVAVGACGGEEGADGVVRGDCPDGAFELRPVGRFLLAIDNPELSVALSQGPSLASPGFAGTGLVLAAGAATR